MQVRIQLMGVLKSRTPENGIVELPGPCSIDDALRALDIAPGQYQVVMVNGKAQPDRDRLLAAGDELTVVPPVGGG